VKEIYAGKFNNKVIIINYNLVIEEKIKNKEAYFELTNNPLTVT